MTLHPRIDDLLELRHQARTLGVASHHLVNATLLGLYRSVFRGEGLDFEEVREYREGDDIRNMDWRVTARTGTAHLKVYREERERSVLLCVEQGPAMDFGTRGTFKSVQAARAAALLGWSASLSHDRVGMLLWGPGALRGLSIFPPQRGRRALWQGLHALANPDAAAAQAPAGTLEDALQRLKRGLHHGSLIFLIGSFEGELGQTGRMLGALQQRHTVVLLPVDDPADRELPAMGQVLFDDGQGHLLAVETDDEAARARYRADWDARRDALRQLANRLGLLLMPLRTDEDVHRTLLAGLQRHVERRHLPR